MVAAAIVITLLARIPGALHLLIGYPEVLFMQGGMILIISKYLDLQLFANRNPFMPEAPAAPAPPASPATANLRVVGE
jgi:hypothetical protein